MSMAKITKFRIQRSDPTHGILYQKMWDGSEEPISTAMEYSKCMMFVQEKQKELKIWRISAIGPRRNAVRHKRMDIYAEDKNEALLTSVIMREPPDRAFYVKLKGLDPDKYYIDEDTDEVYSGALLMNAGLAFTTLSNDDGDSFVKYFKAVE